MLTCTARLTGTAPLGFSAPIASVKKTGENHDAFEERTWRERMRVNESGLAFIGPQNLKNSLAECAKYLSETVPGKGKATYTKHFEAGVMVVKPMVVTPETTRETVEHIRIFVPSDGRRGGGSRVWKNFPIIPKWELDCEIIVLDPILTDKPAKIEEYLTHAGNFIGMGFFRPRNNGYYGRWTVSKFNASKSAAA